MAYYFIQNINYLDWNVLVNKNKIPKFQFKKSLDLDISCLTFGLTGVRKVEQNSQDAWSKRFYTATSEYRL